MKRKTLFIGMLISFLVGVFVFDFFRSGVVWGMGVLVQLFLLFPRIPMRVVLLWGGALLLGMVRVFLAVSEASPDEVVFYASEDRDVARAEIVGVVSDFPDIRVDKTKVTVSVESIAFGEEAKRAVEGKILVNIARYPEVEYGDRLRISGSLRVPPEWEDFSYRRFLEKEGIYAYVPWANFEVMESGKGLAVFSMLFGVRSSIEQTLRDRIPEPEASFAVGILLGGERGFSQEIVEEFRITGLSHLLALSGSNITILILFVFWLCQGVPKYLSLGVTVVFVTGFVLLTGGDASVVRAAVMGMMALFVLHFGQEGNPLYVLLWSMGLMVMWNPFLLVSDVSFQLSVAAVVGLIAFVPIWQGFFGHIPGIFGFREALQTTLAAQITAVPLVAFYFQRVSLISPISNLLVAPLIPFGMLLSFLSLFPVVGPIFGFLAYGVLHLGLWITHVFAQIPMADIAFSVGIVGLLLLYVLAFGLWWWRREKKEEE